MSGGTSEQIEIERKYSVGAEFVMPDLSGAPAVAAVTSPHTYHLTAIYFDTPGFRLVSAHITLRRRTGGTDAGWHLKLPAGAERREVHAPLESGTDTVPAELAGLVSGRDRGPAAAPDRAAADGPHRASPHGRRRPGPRRGGRRRGDRVAAWPVRPGTGRGRYRGVLAGSNRLA